MAVSKRHAFAGGGAGGDGRCTHHRGNTQEMWLRTRDVTDNIIGNLKEAIKLLQDENSSVMSPNLPPSVQATEYKRKAAVKKVLNKLGRALNQTSTVELYTADLNEEMHNMHRRLHVCEKAQMPASEQRETCNAAIDGSAQHYKDKLQEALDRLHDEENLRAKAVRELEAARTAADLSLKEKALVEEQLQRRDAGQTCDPETRSKLVASEEKLRAENKKLKKLYSTALEEKAVINSSHEAASKNAALAAANVERYKKVVAKVTADNMVFLMKLKHSEAALSASKAKVGDLQKEIECGRVQWLDEASSEIQEVVRSSLSKAETCEAKLQALQGQQNKIDEQWEEKLAAATAKLAQVTSSRDWFEKSLIEVTERCNGLQEERVKLMQRCETECQHRQHAEAESTALICTLRKTNEELAEVHAGLRTSLKETESQRNCVLAKEREMKKLFADLEKAKLDVETQRAINGSLMKKKEEMEWELMTAEAHRVRSHQNVNQRLLGKT